jgi:hypothetical protein
MRPVREERRGALDPPSEHVLMGSKTRQPLELPDEVDPAHARVGGEGQERQVSGEVRFEVRFDEVGDPAQAARRDAGRPGERAGAARVLAHELGQDHPGEALASEAAQGPGLLHLAHQGDQGVADEGIAEVGGPSQLAVGEGDLPAALAS